MKKSALLIVLVSTLLLSGCGNKEEPSSSTSTGSTSTSETTAETTNTDSTSTYNEEFDEPVPEGKVRVKLPAEVRDYSENEEKTHYSLLFDYSDTYFDGDAKAFNKDLALLSLGSAIATWEKDRINFLFKTADFDNIENHGYEGLPTTESIGYTFAHKKISDYHLIAIAFRGFNYGAEWSNNLKMGQNGNHQGFEEKVSEAYSSLKIYLGSYSNIKLWINGYSRAGAMSNLLSNKIFKANEISVTESNMFTYTFEAPRGVHEDNLGNYQDIHNMVDSLDLIQDIPPKEYSLYRDGVDTEIYKENVSELAHAFDEHINIPALQQSIGYYKTDLEFLKFFHDYLFINGVSPEKEDQSLYTRDNFYNLYQESIRLVVGIIFSLKQESLDAILNQFKTMSVLDFTSLLTEDRVFNSLNPYVKEDGIAYNEEEFKEACLVLNNLLELNLSVSLSLFKNLSRVIAMHYPEVTYVLLKAL